MTTMDVMLASLGVDPGGTFAGVIGRHGERLVVARVLDADKLLTPELLAYQPDRRRAWADIVLAAVEDARNELATALDHPLTITNWPPVIGVEDINRPTGRRRGDAWGTPRGAIDPTGLIGAAVILGAVLGRYPEAIVVRPGGHGDGPDFAYPEGIRKGRRGLGGPPKHARSAWDIAGLAAVHARRVDRTHA